MNKINFIPSVWGSGAWKFLHCIALSYPAKPSQQDKTDYKEFFLLLEKVLPCDTCSGNFNQHIKEIPIDKHLNGPHDLFSWTVKMRNAVQKELGRSLYDEVSLRNSLYVANERAGGFLNLDPKFKLLLGIGLTILALYIVSRFFKVKITPKK